MKIVINIALKLNIFFVLRNTPITILTANNNESNKINIIVHLAMYNYSFLIHIIWKSI